MYVSNASELRRGVIGGWATIDCPIFGNCKPRICEAAIAEGKILLKTRRSWGTS